MCDLAIRVHDQELKDGYLLGSSLSFHSALWGQLVFEDRNGAKLGLNYDEEMSEGGGFGPLYFRVSSAIERRRDWRMLPYGAPGIAKETWMTEVFVRLPLPDKRENGGHVELFLQGIGRGIPVLVLKEVEAVQIAEALRTCYNPGIAVAHADRASTVSRQVDLEEHRAWLKEYVKEHKYDISQNSLISLSTHIPVRYRALIFDEFPDRDDAPPLGEQVGFSYEPFDLEPTSDEEDSG